MGDPPGMAVAHATASGMGGMRTAGDLVARMQMARGMRIKDAKAYVANKLGISTLDLVDPIVMSEIREELGIGLVTPLPKRASGIECILTGLDQLCLFTAQGDPRAKLGT